MNALNVLAPDIGLAPACAALRINRAGIYRDNVKRWCLHSKVQFNAGDGILLQWSSKLNFVASATTSGGNGGYGLQCPDAESSVVGLQMLITSPPNGAGDVSPTCTGF